MPIIENIREIRLYSQDKKSYLSLNDTRFLAGKISGLGNNFSVTYHETKKQKVKTNIKPNFEDISIQIYFNADGNGYRNYKYLMNFLTQNGENAFALEYNDGVTTKFCDVILKSAPKSEIDEYGVFSENFVFERQYYWYEEKEENFSLKSTDATKVSFPLPFPFGFIGQSFINSYTINNNFFEEAPIKITIIGPVVKNPIVIQIKDEVQSKTISEISLKSSVSQNEILTIDASSKKIIFNKNGIESNAYDLTDKMKQSFLYLPLGTYTITTNLDLADAGTIEITIKRYLLD